MLEHPTSSPLPKAASETTAQISPISWLYTRSPATGSKLSTVTMDWSAGIAGLVPLSETFAAGEEVVTDCVRSQSSFEYPFESITQNLKHNQHPHFSKSATQEQYDNNKSTTVHQQPPVIIRYPASSNGHFSSKREDLNVMFPTPQPSPMKYRRGRPSSFALFTQNLASSSSSSSSSPPSAILEAEVPTTTNQVEVAPSIVSSGSFATSSNSGNLIPALALQSSRPLTKKGLPKGKGKNFDPPSSSPLAIATTPTSGSNTTTTTTTTTGTAKKSTNLMEAATLLQTTLNSSPNHTRRRRRQTTLAAKTETLGAALETLRQKRREEAAGLIQLLKSRAGALGSYGKELRKYRGGEGEEEEGRGFGEDDFIDEEEGGGGGGGHNDEETADERDNVRGRSRDVYEGEEEGDIFPTPRLSTAASFLSDGRLEEEEDDEDLEEETEEEVKEAVETDMDYTPSGMVPTVIAGRRRKGKQTKLGKMADNELGGSAKRRRKEGDAEQGLTPTAKKRKSPSLRQQVEYSPVLYKTQSSDGGFGQYLPGESEGRRQRLRTRSELIGQEKELYYSNVDTAFMLTSAAELLLGRQDSFGDEMSVEGEKKEDGDDVGNDAMEVDGSASAEDRKGLDLLALALGFS